MPPKRKRAADPNADAPEPTTRATRSSNRNVRDDTTNLDSTDAMQVDPPPKKKARGGTTGSRASGKSKKKGAANINDEAGAVTTGGPPDSEPISGTPVQTQQPHSPSLTTESTLDDILPDPNTPIPKAPSTASLTKPEPYTPQRALALFNKYVDPDDPNSIGPEQFMQLCSDADIPMEGALPLFLSWQMEGTEMAKLTRECWVKGTSALKISSLPTLSLALKDLEALVLLGQKPLKRTTAKDPYDRTAYWGRASDPLAAFQKFYTFCFNLAKPLQSKNLDMETSTAIWSVVLVPRYPIMSDVLEFINVKGGYKATNKDLWNMMLEFCQSVQSNLSNYEDDGAWPTLVDDFVSWKKSKTANSEAMDV